jgi:hypothetical protein
VIAEKYSMECAAYTFDKLKPKYRYTLMRKLANKVSNPGSIHILLHNAILYNLPDIVSTLIPKLSSTGEVVMNVKFRLAHIEYPIFTAFTNKNIDPVVITILRDMLPKPYTFNMSKRFYKYFKGIKAFGLMELAVFYGRLSVVKNLLENSEYHSYAKSNAALFADKSLRAGNLKMAKIFLELKGSCLNCEHLPLVLAYLNDEECKEAIKEVQSRDMLDYKDEEGNNILHLIALYGRKEIMLLLAELNIFDFTSKKQYRNKLLEKNNLKVCPFVLAIMFNNLEIANALFILPDTIDNFTKEEIKYMDRKVKPIKAWTEFNDEKVYPSEAKIDRKSVV